MISHLAAPPYSLLDEHQYICHLYGNIFKIKITNKQNNKIIFSSILKHGAEHAKKMQQNTWNTFTGGGGSSSSPKLKKIKIL
jgi:hypothetical protein